MYMFVYVVLVLTVGVHSEYVPHQGWQLQWSNFSRACAAVVPPGVDCLSDYNVLACGDTYHGEQVAHMDHLDVETGVLTNVVVRQSDAHKVASL